MWTSHSKRAQIKRAAELCPVEAIKCEEPQQRRWRRRQYCADEASRRPGVRRIRKE